MITGLMFWQWAKKIIYVCESVFKSGKNEHVLLWWQKHLKKIAKQMLRYTDI